MLCLDKTSVLHVSAVLYVTGSCQQVDETGILSMLSFLFQNHRYDASNMALGMFNELQQFLVDGADRPQILQSCYDICNTFLMTMKQLSATAFTDPRVNGVKVFATITYPASPINHGLAGTW